MLQDSASIGIEPTALMGFMLALVRASVFVAIAPPFNSRAIPVQVKIGFSTALAIASSAQLETGNLSLDWIPLSAAVATQAVTGLLLGFVAFLLFNAVQAAGQLIDLFGGFTLSPAYDPLSDMQAGTFGRVYQLLATVLLFATGGHLLLIKGFLGSFDAVGLSGLGTQAVGQTMTSQMGAFFVAAIEIAGPILAALVVAEVVLGMLSRAAPLMNVFALGFPFKIFLTIATVGMALPLLPHAVNSLVTESLDVGNQLIGR